METSTNQLIDIEPKKALYFEGPFTDIVTSHISLTNPHESTVCFKVKTTVPKRYCVRPSSGILKPKESLNVAVMLQPFNYDQQEKSKHKFMIQSMVLKDEDQTNLDLVWKEADPAKIMDSKLICVLRMPGELVVEPSHELIFEGPFNKSVTSTVHLANPSRDRIYFQVQASSHKLSAVPTSGVIDPNQTLDVLVSCKPLDFSGADKPRERIMIKSVVLKDSESRSPEELLTGNQASDTLLKCIFNTPGPLSADERIKPTRQAYSMASAPDSGPNAKIPSIDALMAELNTLRKENKLLKEADIQLRRTALSDTCLSSAAGGGAAIGRQGALGILKLLS
ncbi:unnamed protein product [Dicrocoelium dendriticum]|nr:unnamed protein product [Dicrocoelium dendriticum]